MLIVVVVIIYFTISQEYRYELCCRASLSGRHYSLDASPPVHTHKVRYNIHKYTIILLVLMNIYIYIYSLTPHVRSRLIWRCDGAMVAMGDGGAI